MSMPPAAVENKIPSPKPNPRRQPAHLSVSLRHETPPHVKVNTTGTLPHSTRKKASKGSSDADGTQSTGINAQKWFDRANSNPKVTFSQVVHDDPPYFLPEGNTPNSRFNPQARLDHELETTRQISWPNPGPPTNTDTADDFRSVIDDLTVENKKLKERLRRLEKLHSPHLENDRLFEVTIHGLSAKKRRKLEETLRDFTAQLDESSSSDTPKDSSEDVSPDHVARSSAIKLSTGTSSSKSRPVDSAYASMSTSAQNSMANLVARPGHAQRHRNTQQENAEQVEYFLDNIPGGLLPRRNLVMTEKQKRKIVVQRLEQLFTGKRSALTANGQSQQQQEVSRSAARADDAAAHREAQVEGLREAHMLPSKTGDVTKPGKLPSNDSRDDTLESRDASNSSEGSVSEESDIEQRPTRPLDLDPDRAQVPADNVEYLRHLGVSTPQLMSDDSSDADSDAQGWIYLNLLINMAQLHIINVTPDFVRHAVQDSSEKLQLSRDGQKLRWRGGHEGTQLDSNDSSESTNDSDAVGPETIKRRKTNAGRFATVPVNVGEKIQSSKTNATSKLAQYRPMFNHHGTSTGSGTADDTMSNMESHKTYDKGQNMSATWSQVSQGVPRHKRRRDDGTMVFYSNAQFCTDLSGDREIPVPLHSRGLGNDACTTTNDVLGCKPGSARLQIFRTESGSSLPHRPLKGSQPVVVPEDASDFAGLQLYAMSGLERPISRGREASPKLQVFAACGLGGTQPADHFALRVQTRRPVEDRLGRLSKFSAPSSRMTRFLHRISQSSLDTFTEAKEDTPETEENMDTSDTSDETTPEVPVQIEYISANFTRLEPSELPEPMGYYGASSTSDDEFSDIAPTSISFAPRRTFFHKSYTSLTEPDTHKLSNEIVDQYESISDVSEEGSDSDDELSVDMMGHLRQTNADIVDAKQRQYDRELDQAGTSVEPETAASAAATIAESDIEL